MRILYIVESAATGVGRHLAELIEGVLAKGHAVDVVYSPVREDDAFRRNRERLGAAGVRFTALPMRRAPGPWDVPAVLALRRHIRRFGPYDVLHGHSSKGGMLARLAGIGTPARVVYTPHAVSTLDPTLGRLKRFVLQAGELALSRPTNAIVAVSTGEAECLLRMGIARSRVVTILNAIEPPAPPPRAQARRKLGLAEGDLAVGFVGRLTRHKAIDVMVASFAEARKAAPRLRLVVVGDGDMAGQAKAQAEALGCADAVHWLGAQDALRWYGAFDLLAQPSRYEGLSYTLLEAAALGLPVVATDVGGTRDVIESGVNGLVVPEIGDAGAFARALARLASDPALLDSLAAAARRRIALGGTSVMVEATLAVYDGSFDQQDYLRRIRQLAGGDGVVEIREERAQAAAGTDH